MVANIAAAPTPCTVRAATRNPAFGARPQASEDRANSAKPGDVGLAVADEVGDRAGRQDQGGEC